MSINNNAGSGRRKASGKYGLDMKGAIALARIWKPDAAFSLEGLMRPVKQEVCGESCGGKCKTKSKPKG